MPKPKSKRKPATAPARPAAPATSGQFEALIAEAFPHASKLAQIIQAYYAVRGLAIPDAREALGFAVCELGECFEQQNAKDAGKWKRNNPARHKPYTERAFAEECGDVIMMAFAAAWFTAGLNPLEALLNKMRRKVADESTGTLDATPPNANG